MDYNSISIRRVVQEDSKNIARLCIQLGYEAVQKVITERLLKLINEKDTVLFVAEMDGQVAGWVQASIRSAVETGEFAEITGLVVDESLRGKGIGKRLVVKTEEWAKSLGFNSIRVRTNILRTETHLFYRGIGFEEKKKQTVFQKKLI
jgi:GNAT superfamily N-acetyltransferase